ncbi:MAG: hypothetical protein RMJ33_05935 [Saprospiraceae bacterium]|nr:hypothetical protein [Saprospiraceae bacterium]MDW8229359.1 hypothetical protein [Saprospiraceae bacterium]
MKNFYVALLYLLTATALEGQTYFAPVGTRWQYFRYQFGPWPPIPPVAEVIATDTVVVQGKPCLKIEGGKTAAGCPSPICTMTAAGFPTPFTPANPFNSCMTSTRA